MVSAFQLFYQKMNMRKRRESDVSCSVPALSNGHQKQIKGDHLARLLTGTQCKYQKKVGLWKENNLLKTKYKLREL